MEEEVQDTPPRQRRVFPAAAAIGWSILPITEHRGEKRLVWKDRQGPEEPGLATSFTGSNLGQTSSTTETTHRLRKA